VQGRKQPCSEPDAGNEHEEQKCVREQGYGQRQG
jgi:hypothetical protein